MDLVKNLNLSNSTNFRAGETKSTTPAVQHAPIKPTIRDTFVKEHKKSGLVARLYNVIKNATGLGVGSKKVEDIVTKAEKGEVTDEQALETINKYRNSQATSSQICGDALSIAAAAVPFFMTRETIAENAPQAYLRQKHGIIKPKKKTNLANLSWKNLMSKIGLNESELIEHFKHPTKKMIKLGLIASFTAGSIKWLFGIIDRIGSKEFVVDKKDYNGAIDPYDKSAYSMAKKEERSEKHAANFKNFASGAINGVTLPLTAILGGFVGVPLYLAVNTLNRYFIGNHTDQDKSLKGYAEDLKNDSITHSALALGAGIPMFIKTHRLDVLKKVKDKAVKKLENITYRNVDFNSTDSYEELSKLLLEDHSIKAIIQRGNSVRNSEEASNLADELVRKNIFAAKFKQIEGRNDALTIALKEDCKQTRSIEAAQDYVNQVFEQGKYQIEKCLGTGTVAETFLAKDKDGKEVVIKITKDFMTKEKIDADYDAFVTIVNRSNKSDTEKQKLIRGIDTLKQKYYEEIDLQHEFDAAKALEKSTKFAQVVKGIEVKENAYVMERAKGISLETLMKLNDAYTIREALVKAANSNGIISGIDNVLSNFLLQKDIVKGTDLYNVISNNYMLTARQRLNLLDQYIEKIEARTPGHDNIKLEPKDVKNLLREYQQVLVEQFNKISPEGKTIHGDIHPGNIFVDIEALRAMPEEKDNILSRTMDKYKKIKRQNHNVFTFIDTGNIINLSKEQSMSLMNLSSYIEHANYKEIAKYAMQGVEGDALGGRTKEQATKILEDELKEYFFNPNKPLEIMTNENMIKLTSYIMRKHGIQPADTQVAINKAIKSANQSYESLVDGLTKQRLSDNGAISHTIGGGAADDASRLKQLKKAMEKSQEKENLASLSSSERKALKNKEGNLKENDEKYQIYILKQGLMPQSRMTA